MYVINEQTHIVNVWADTEINQRRLESEKYGVVLYTGEVEEGYDGLLYATGYAPTPTIEEFMVKVRLERDARITACDWVIIRHGEQMALGVNTILTADEYAAWLSYRQALRDLPLQEGFPWSGGDADDEVCPWPSKPTVSTVAE